MYLIYAIVSVFIAYLIGNISPSTIMAKAKGIDIKQVGSGNAGTTNALRVMGKKAGAITAIVDVLKGTLAVFIGWLAGTTALTSAFGVSQDYMSALIYWAALAVLCGHVWPIFLKFKGGKGVATAFGAVLAINWQMALIALGIVVILVFITKRMSVGSMVGAISLPVLSVFMEEGFVVFASIMACIILVKHRANVIRLIHGEEPIMSIFEKDNK